VVDPSGPGEQYTSIALDSAGSPRISYYDFQGLKLKTAQAYRQQGSLPEASQPVASNSNSGGYPALVALNGTIGTQLETLSRQNLRRLLPLAKIPPGPDSSAPILDLAWSYDSQILAFRTFDEIFLFDRNSGFIKQIEAKGQALAFSPSGPYLAYSDELDSVLKLWDYEKDQSIASTKMNLAIVSLRFSRDGTQLGSGHQDDSLGFWKVPALEYYGGYTNHDKVLAMPLEAFDISPDGKIALAASYKTIFKLYIQDKTADLEGNSMAGAIHSLTYSPGGQQFAACSDNTELKIWPVDGLIPSVIYDRFNLEDGIVSIVYSKAGDILFGLEESGRLVALSPFAAEILATYSAHDPERMGVDLELSPDGSLLASAASDGSVVFWGAP
jgi:WD40 repeat protein